MYESKQNLKGQCYKVVPNIWVWLLTRDFNSNSCFSGTESLIELKFGVLNTNFLHMMSCHHVAVEETADEGQEVIFYIGSPSQTLKMAKVCAVYGCSNKSNGETTRCLCCDFLFTTCNII